MLIITIALLGVIVGLITKYVEMPPVFKTVIWIIAAVCLVFLLMQAFGITDVPVPKVNN
jgi:sulfite exporter TauE/SafE